MHGRVGAWASAAAAVCRWAEGYYLAKHARSRSAEAFAFIGGTFENNRKLANLHSASLGTGDGDRGEWHLFRDQAIRAVAEEPCRGWQERWVARIPRRALPYRNNPSLFI